MLTTAVSWMLTMGVAMAQQPSHQHDPTQQPPASPAKPSMPNRGGDAQMTHQHMGQHMAQHMAQHMEMCRQMMGQQGMMGGGMGGGMMGMPMMMGGDPKQQAEMLAMRGEMMKAMGDIMMKYAQRAQSVK
jgi:hypothetical protein